MGNPLPTSGLDLPCAEPNFTGIPVVIAQPAYSVSYVRSSARSGVFGNLPVVTCACGYLRNEDFGGLAMSGNNLKWVAN